MSDCAVPLGDLVPTVRFALEKTCELLADEFDLDDQERAALGIEGRAKLDNGTRYWMVNN